MAAAVKKTDARKARGVNVRKDQETENLDQNRKDQSEKGSRTKKTTVPTEAAKSIPTRTLARRGGGGGGKRGACGPGQGTGRRRRAGTAVKGKNKNPLFTPDQVKEIVNIALKLKTFLGRTYSLPEDFCKARRWVALCQKTNGENGMN